MRDIPLHHEVSFQGGDGYVLFGSRRLALTTLVSMMICGCEGAQKEPEDRFMTILISVSIFSRISRTIRPQCSRMRIIAMR